MAVALGLGFDSQVPRAGRPEGIGELAAFLASDAGPWTTNQASAVDGGYTLR